MNKHSPLKSRGSLLERASEIYDFSKMAAPIDIGPDVAPVPGAMPVAKPEPMVAKAAAPDTPVEPVPVRMQMVTPGWLPAPQIKLESKPASHPMQPARTGSVDIDALRDAGFVVPDAPVTAISEEFRMVKRQLLLTANGNGKPLPRGRMILICSAQPNEGKTFCAVNLALSMAAEKDVQVLLVDGDIAKPEIPAMLGLEPGPGLMDALADPALDVESCVIQTDIPGFSVLPAGRQTNSDTELLASAHTRSVLEGLLTRHPERVVIIDSPPALAASPASVLALHAGQVLMVVRADQTSEADLRDAIGLLAGCDTIQLLLNGAKLMPGGRRFGAYYGYGE